MKIRIAIAAFLLMASAFAEIQVVNGVKYECVDGQCRIVDPTLQPSNLLPSQRLAHGYMPADEFIAFLENRDEPEEIWMTTSVGSLSFWLGVLMIILGGLALNLTPCVLPMVPINLMIIGKSAARGAWYGLGIALAYGTLGVLAAVGGLAFGTIQGNPWFNLFIAILFVFLALALSGLFVIDLSRFRRSPSTFNLQPSTSNLLFPLFMGVVSAVLAGACVAPILISVLLLTGKLYAEGHVLALGLPFVLGLGMALPWPFLGAGLKVLPRPGAWMKWVNRLFALLVFGFAVWYGRLAWNGFQPDAARTPRLRANVTPATLHLHLTPTPKSKPILVDCWASWCKNCAAMEQVMEKTEVKKALEGFTVIRVQAEDLSELRKVKGFESVRGLPAFVIFD